ncbi:hypothetical protein A3D11_03140 [Candidatus Peribacteria bacterium RIFCSPHIGHO2_02_FULL_49_16]|nr:MAG: hypothetical protein A2880_01420 [Candidatus Peribacteria bacterium RIFCSPHIGHO2_01_FULL_49_38]OGJ58578.1 MAG: hypothetical protein A3D11_03140 [Candidatus Peribacteria bacterium RIFCSPHIGHO2_02_FULL_49_16]
MQEKFVQNLEEDLLLGWKEIQSFPQFSNTEIHIHQCSMHVSQQAKSVLKLDTHVSEFMENEAETYKKCFLEKGTYLLHITLQPYEQLGSEGWIEQDIVFLRDHKGNTLHIPVFKKAVTAGAPRCHEKALEHVQRLEDLQSLGVPVIEIFIVDTATIYSRLYPNNLYETLQIIEHEKEGWTSLLEQLIRIGKTIDENGYHAQNFINDLLYDGTTFRYADAGSDLGGTCTEHSKNCLTTLLRKFHHQKIPIRHIYESLSVPHRKSKKIA